MSEVDVARLVRTVEEVQEALCTAVLGGHRVWQHYDADSWEIFVGHQMQRILDVVAPQQGPEPGLEILWDAPTDEAEKEWIKPLPKDG